MLLQNTFTVYYNGIPLPLRHLEYRIELDLLINFYGNTRGTQTVGKGGLFTDAPLLIIKTAVERL